VEVNGVKIYNADPFNVRKLDCLILKKLVKDKKRRKCFDEQLDVGCG
jgi:hypothetical protein